MDARVVLLHPGPLATQMAASGLEPRVFDAGRMRSVRDMAKTQRWLWGVLSDERPNLVVSGEPTAHVHVAGLAALKGIPALWRQPARPNRRGPIDRLAVKLPARGVIVASEFIAREQRVFGSRAVTVVRPGIDVQRLADVDGRRMRRQHRIHPRAPVVGIVGRLQQWKGQELFLQAAAAVSRSHPEAVFVVVGGAEMGWETGDFPEQLRALARELGIDDRVVFTGQVPEAADWYAAMDIVVHASDHEPFGLVVAEAMLSGCAVISSRQGGPPEIIVDDETGVLVAHRTADDFAEAIGQLLSDPALRARLGTAARAWATDQLTAPRMVGDFARVAQAAMGSA